MLERFWVAPLPFRDEKASSFPLELGHSFSLQMLTKPAWLEHERKNGLFLSTTDIELLDTAEYWLVLPVGEELAVGQAAQDSETKMNLFLFLATLISPCYDMFTPSFLVERISSIPEGWVRLASGLRESHQLCLPEMFRHNVLTVASLRSAADCIDRCLILHSSKQLPFRIAGTFWTLAFKQRIYQLQLLLWVMGIEALSGSSGKPDFVERLKLLVDSSEYLYEDGVSNKYGVRHGSEYKFGQLLDAVYDARGQVAHGQIISQSFLDKLKQSLSEFKPPKTHGDETVPVVEVLVEASCLLLRKLLIATLMDARYFFLVDDVPARKQKFRSLLANQTPVWGQSC